MSFLLIRTKRSRQIQPSGIVEIDDRNPLTDGLISFQDARGFDYVTGRGVLDNASAIQATPSAFGMGRNFAQNQMDFPLNARGGATTYSSLMFLGENSSGTWLVGCDNHGMACRRYTGIIGVFLGDKFAGFSGLDASWTGVQPVVFTFEGDHFSARAFVGGREIDRDAAVTDTAVTTATNTLGGSRVGDRSSATWWGKPAVASARWIRPLTPTESVSLNFRPWQLLRRRERRTFIFLGGSGDNLSASAAGNAVSAGAAGLLAQVALAAVGISTAAGGASVGASIPLSAAGLAISSGAANGIAGDPLSASGAAVAGGSAVPAVAVTIAAAALATAAGLAGLSAGVLAAGAGSAQAAGNAALATQLYGQAVGAALAQGNAALAAAISAAASGSASAAGLANLTGGLPGSASAIGGAEAGGQAALKVRVDLVANGLGIAAGQALLTTTATLSAAGFVEAMGSGSWRIALPLAAFGNASAWGSATPSLYSAEQEATQPVAIVISVDRWANLAIDIDSLNVGVAYGG